MKKIITILQKDLWIRYVHNARHFDFYHTWFYHTLEKIGIPLLFVYEEGNEYIAFPLLKRQIPGSDFFDLTSVYGYAGPISNQDFDLLDGGFMERFKNSFLNFLSEAQTVSVFSRLHPFFNQRKLMDRFSGVHENGKTVAIDLEIPIEQQRAGYRRSVREKIKKLRRIGYQVISSNDAESIREFAAIYAENMKRIGAKDYYLFNETYMRNLLSSDEFEGKLFLVYKDGKAVSGALVICTCKIMQVHLLATLNNYLFDSPAKLLTDEITLAGREMGCKYFNLGGGLNFKEDLLFDWKIGFSNLLFEFTSWRYVANEQVYNDLLNELEVDPASTIDFFPLYRIG